MTIVSSGSRWSKKLSEIRDLDKVEVKSGNDDSARIELILVWMLNRTSLAGHLGLFKTTGTTTTLFAFHHRPFHSRFKR